MYSILYIYTFSSKLQEKLKKKRKGQDVVKEYEFLWELRNYENLKLMLPKSNLLIIRRWSFCTHCMSILLIFNKLSTYLFSSIIVVFIDRGTILGFYFLYLKITKIIVYLYAVCFDKISSCIIYVFRGTIKI